MSSFLPYREEDGYVYLYEWEANTAYKKGEVLRDDENFYRAERDFTSDSNSPYNDVYNNNLSVYNRIQLTGPLRVQNSYFSAGPVYGFSTGNLTIGDNQMCVGYRLVGIQARNAPDGGETDAQFQHYMYTRDLKTD